MKSPQTSLKLIVYWISYFINYKTSWKFSNAHAFIFIFKKGIVSYWKYSVHYNFLWVYIGKCRFERIVSPTSLDPLPTINEGSITPEYIEVSSDFQFRAILWSDKHFAMQILILFFRKNWKENETWARSNEMEPIIFLNLNLNTESNLLPIMFIREPVNK